MGLFKKRASDKNRPRTPQYGTGILVFANTSEVIRAEKVLKGDGWSVRVMGPPPEIRTGCDLVIEFPMIEKLRVLRTWVKPRSPLSRWCLSTAPCSNLWIFFMSRISGTISWSGPPT